MEPDSPAWERLRDWIAGVLRRDPASLTPETRLRDLTADSLDQVELTMAFEEDFEVDVPDELAERGLDITLGELAHCIRPRDPGGG
jgi:acyl carrier protein